jgi:hypothetical protein
LGLVSTEALEPLFDPQAPILLDDFIERTFFYDRGRNVNLWHRQPWVGVMHHPPDMPKWYMDSTRLQHLHADPRRNRSLPNLRMIIALGDNLRDWCRQQWPNIPAVTIKHPTGLPQVYWSPDAFLANPRKKVAQAGWFLRNMIAIHQAGYPKGSVRSRCYTQRVDQADYLGLPRNLRATASRAAGQRRGRDADESVRPGLRHAAE